MNLKKLSLLFGSVVFLGVLGDAFCADLKAPMELETAQVLPQGVRNPRFKNLIMFIDSRLDSTGKTQELGAKLNQQVTWQALIQSPQNKKEDQEKLKGLLMANGIGADNWTNDGPGLTTGKISTYVNAKVPVLAYGVSSRLTIAIAVPIIHAEANVDTGFVSNHNSSNKESNVNKFYAALCDIDPIKCNSVKTQLSDPINAKLAVLGYEPLKSRVVNGVGDIKLVTKYQVLNSEKNFITLRSDFTAPTGTAPNADMVLDIPTGDGRYQLGGSVVWDHFLSNNLWLNTYGSYVALFANKMEKRIPTQESSLSKDKEELRRNYGYGLGLGTSLSVKSRALGLSFGAGYGVQFQSKTTYKDGLAFEYYRYRLLEGDSPSQTLHSATLMATFSTVDWFKEKIFAIPLQAQVSFSRPFKGRNVTKNDVLMGEIVLFF